MSTKNSYKNVKKPNKHYNTLIKETDKPMQNNL
jgi:hypothetical protein